MNFDFEYEFNIIYYIHYITYLYVIMLFDNGVNII